LFYINAGVLRAMFTIKKGSPCTSDNVRQMKLNHIFLGKIAILGPDTCICIGSVARGAKIDVIIVDT
jgi:hypothetical protein